MPCDLGFLGGWAGASLNSAANTLILLSFGLVFFFPPKGTTCYASFGPDVHISVAAIPAKNTNIYLCVLPAYTEVAAEMQQMTES